VTVPWLDKLSLHSLVRTAKSIRWIMRLVGGDFWLYCAHCGGVLPLDEDCIVKHHDRCKIYRGESNG